MATPASPISAPAASAAPAAPAAPIAPAASAPPASSAPSSAGPPVAVPAAAPEAPPAPAPAAPAAAPAGPPKQEDFPSTEQGLEDFIEAQERFRQEHPDEAAAAEEARRKEADTQRPGVEQPEEKPAEVPKVEEEAPKPPEAKAAEAATPEVLDRIFAENPALKAALDANPAHRDVLMETARTAAAAAPVLAIVPTVAEAEFAVGNANTFLGVQHKFALAAEDPETYGTAALTDLASLFHMTDDKGQTIKNPDGSNVMAPSWDFLTKSLSKAAVSDFAGEAKKAAEQLDAAVVAAGAGATDAQREAATNARYKADALAYVAEILGAADDDLGLPALPAGATPEQIAFQKELEKQAQALKGDKSASTKAARVKERQAFETKINQAWGSGIGKVVDTEIAARRARGEYIPDIILNKPYVNPQTHEVTKFPDFAVRIGNEFTAKVYSIPSIKAKLQELELGGKAMEQARLDYHAQLRTTYLPKIIDNYLTEVQDGVRQMAGAQTRRNAAVAEVVRTEPQTGTGIPAPPARLTGEALQNKVRENLANNAEYREANRSDRAEMEIMEAERIRAGR